MIFWWISRSFKCTPWLARLFPGTAGLEWNQPHEKPLRYGRDAEAPEGTVAAGPEACLSSR